LSISFIFYDFTFALTVDKIVMCLSSSCSRRSRNIY